MTRTSPRRLDLVGQRFGRLLVQDDAGTIRQPSGQVVRIWWCLCDCGKKTTRRTGQLRSGATISCGCAISDATIKRCTKHGEGKRLQRTREYICWKQMRSRCSNERRPDFKYYGARGIKVCKRWDRFESFLKDMGRKPSPSHSIDRINGDGDYKPSNCRWTTPLEQRRNRRDYIAAHGMTIKVRAAT